MNKTGLDNIYAGLRGSVESLGYDCVGFELAVEDGMNILRVYVDMPGGVNLSDCETIAREVTEYLDTNEQYLPDRYFLEVSSPGLERPLFTYEDYRRFDGKEARIVLNNKKIVTGFIKNGEEDGIINIMTSDGERKISFSDIKKGNLQYREEKGQKKTFKKIPKKK